MRITGGRAGGIPLKRQGQAHAPLDRLRESVFQSWRSIEGLQSGRSFAGTGNYGLKTLSRGATSSPFESDYAALNARQNVRPLCVVVI